MTTTAQKFHINQKTGTAAPCSASVRDCPVGGEHYDSLEKAEAAYASSMSSKTFPSKPSKAVVKKWGRLDDVYAEIDSINASAATSLRHVKVLEKAMDIVEKGKLSDNPAAQNEYARNALAEIQKTEPYVPNAPRPWFPNSEYKTLGDVGVAVELKLSDTDMLLDRYSAELDGLEGERDELEKELKEKTGYVSNPIYGVPSGETTEDLMKKPARNYSSAPTKNVPILENGEQICTRCGSPATYEEAKAPGQIGRYVDENCDEYIRTAGKCKYCGTTNPKHLSFKQQSYSDETHCSRCGGVDGYGIGD